MTGFLNPHGTPLGLNGQFVSLSDSDDEVRAFEHPDLMVFPDVDREVVEDELDDTDLELTIWSSLLLASDYHWPDIDDDDIEDTLWNDRDIARWVQGTFGDVISLNDAVGFRPVNVSIDQSPHDIVSADNDNQAAEYDLHPLEHTPRPIDSDFRGYNLNRGKEHRLPRTWKRYADCRSR